MIWKIWWKTGIIIKWFLLTLTICNRWQASNISFIWMWNKFDGKSFATANKPRIEIGINHLLWCKYITSSFEFEKCLHLNEWRWKFETQYVDFTFMDGKLSDIIWSSNIMIFDFGGCWFDGWWFRLSSKVV